MEITKAKNFDTNGVAEFESVDEETHEVTPDMKYIKWPSKKKVFSELVSVAVASIIIAMVIAAGDSIGMTIKFCFEILLMKKLWHHARKRVVLFLLPFFVITATQAY